MDKKVRKVTLPNNLRTSYHKTNHIQAQMEPLPFERVFHTCNEAYKAHHMAMASPHSRMLARLLLTANETSARICPLENHIGAIHPAQQIQ